MKILYDHQIFTAQAYGGISRYFYNLSMELSKIKDLHVKIISPVYVNEYLKANPPDFLTGMPIPSFPKTERVKKLICRSFCERHIKKFNPDILHETYYSLGSFSSFFGPRAITIYDMIHELYPSLFSIEDKSSFLKKESIHRADTVICISENTKRDLLNIFSIPESKVNVVHLGFQELEMDRNSDRFLNDDYILFVGNRAGYKNFTGLLKAFSLSPFLRKDLKILCFGGGVLTVQEKNLIGQLGLADSVVFASGSDSDLARAYLGASAFVYPSLYEGFGIPPLEAMSLDCPVVCSKTSSIPEIVGDAGEFFDPEEPEDIANAIERVISSPERREKLIRNGKTRRALFSWNRCAAETLEIYKALL
jgi:glycosyltransferase involved in cell wall biosynthesis